MRTFIISLTALLAAAAVAQTGRVIKASEAKTFPCKPIDTRQFFPAIDDSFTLTPMQPENPLIRKRPPTNPPAINLPPGGMLDQPRGTTTAYYPGPTFGGLNPPDPDIAVGQAHVVIVVNSTIGFYSKATGANTFLQSGSTFFTGMGVTGTPFDPKVIYDRVHGRYVILFDEQNSSSQVSKVLIAVSDDSDPNGTWYRYRIEAKRTLNGTPCWLDYPALGYNKDAIAFGGNMFSFSSGFQGALIAVVPTTPLLTGAAATTSYIDLLGSSGYGSIQIAEMIDNSIDRIYAAMELNTTTFRLISVGNLTGVPTVTTFDRSISSAFSYPAAQCNVPGGTVDSLDGRVFAVMYRGGRLLTAHTIWPAPAKVRWYEFNMSNWPTSGSPTVTQLGNISNGSFYYHMGVVAKNAAGDISSIFTKSSSSDFPSVMQASRTSGDAAGFMGAPVQLGIGDGTSVATSGRWGDYFGIDVDPVDDTTFWGVGMVVTSPSGRWRSDFFSWVVTPGAPGLTGISATPNPVAGGNSSTGTVTLSANATGAGITVNLSSANTSVAQVPASVLVPNGSNSATFNITTNGVASSTPVTLTATYNSVNVTTSLTVSPASLSGVTVAPSSVVAGNPSTGTVALDAVAPAGGITVGLTSSDISAAQVPSTVLVPAGSSVANFAITTTFVGAVTPVTITASYNVVTKTAVLTVNPSIADIVPDSFSISPGSLLSGGIPELSASDDTRLIGRPGPVLVASQFPLGVTVGAYSPYLTPSAIEIKIESQASVAADEKVEILNALGSYELLNLSAATQGADGTKTFNIGTPSQYVNQTTGAIGLRISYKNTGPVLVYPWQGRIDWIRWRITP